MKRLLLASLVLAVGPGPLRAQVGPERPTLTIMAGPSQYDLSGTGTAPFAGVAVAIPLGRFLLLEPALSVMQYNADFGLHVRHVFPEAQVQAQLPLAGGAAPYLGIGAGRTFVFESGDHFSALTLSAAGGIRIPLSPAWGVRGELRVRAVDPWGAVTADWGLGISHGL